MSAILRGRTVWRLLALAAAVAVGGLAGALWVARREPPGVAALSTPSPGQASLETLGLYGTVPPFTLTERSGRPLTRDDLRGRVWIASFIYTQCTESCPLQTATMARLQKDFAGEPDLRLVSITVDPERDTPAVLTRYAERYGADPARWLFLTGPKRAIYDLARDGFRLGVVDPYDQARAAAPWEWLSPRPAHASHGSKGLVLHSSRLVVVDRQARIRAYHLPDDESSLGRLRQNTRHALAER